MRECSTCLRTELEGATLTTTTNGDTLCEDCLKIEMEIERVLAALPEDTWCDPNWLEA